MTFAKYLLTFIFLSILHVVEASAACVVSGDAKGVLRVYNLPDNTSAIRGGIKVGQCNIVVTDRCEGQWCYTRTGSLLGWIDTQYLDEKVQRDRKAGKDASQRKSIKEVNGDHLIYRVMGGSGVFNMMGIKRNTPVDPGGNVSFSKKNNNSYIMRIKPITPDAIVMKFSGGKWTGKMNNWAGQPMSILVTVFSIGSQNASIKLNGTAPMGTLEMVLKLALQSGGKPEKTAQNPHIHLNLNKGKKSKDSGKTNQLNRYQDQPCKRLDVIEQKAKQLGVDRVLNKINAIKQKRGIIANGMITRGKCLLAVQDIEKEGLIFLLEELFGSEANWPEYNDGNINSNAKNTLSESSKKQRHSTNLGGRDSACRNLRVKLASIMRGNDEAMKKSLRNALKQERVFDIGKANIDQCKNVLAAIGVPIGIEDKKDTHLSKHQGEDPNTMIEGGKENTGSKADFDPANDNHGKRQANPLDKSGAQLIQADICHLANDAIIEVVARGSVKEMLRASGLLKQYNTTNIIHANPSICQKLFSMMQHEGMVR